MITPPALKYVSPRDLPVVSRELMTKEWCTLHRLIEEISRVQTRLGTPLEQVEDCILVRDLGHKIRNKLNILQLWAELGMVERDELIPELSAG